jgi:hypothetical protein
MLFKGPTLFDVSYLDRLDLLGVRFILLCDYRDILTLPYLTKNKKCNATILLTYPMYQMGRLRTLIEADSRFANQTISKRVMLTTYLKRNTG